MTYVGVRTILLVSSVRGCTLCYRSYTTMTYGRVHNIIPVSVDIDLRYGVCVCVFFPSIRTSYYSDYFIVSHLCFEILHDIKWSVSMPFFLRISLTVDIIGLNVQGYQPHVLHCNVAIIILLIQYLWYLWSQKSFSPLFGSCLTVTNFRNSTNGRNRLNHVLMLSVTKAFTEASITEEIIQDAHFMPLVCVCVCFLPIHSGHHVRWTYQPGSHRRKVTQDF